jgi:rhodanese-related sulfurtransferase
MSIITASDLKKKLEKNEICLIDVREPDEHESEYIEGSHLIPLAQISITDLPSESRTIVAYCRSGRRSEEACKRLLIKDSGLTVYSLEGGIIAWKEANYPIKSMEIDLD